MKKFMYKNILLSLMIISISQTANAEKIRDMSLSVEKTNELIQNPPPQQNNPNFGGVGMNNNSGAGFNEDIPLNQDIGRQLRELNTRNTSTVIPPPPRRGQVQQNFINEFCSSGYKSQLAGNPSFQSCQETQRQQACERFSRATVNVQRLLSQAIDCELNTSSLATPECDGLDAGRLDLLKQYWQDEDMSYTVLFLPDMVTNIMANCTSKR